MKATTVNRLTAAASTAIVLVAVVASYFAGARRLSSGDDDAPFTVALVGPSHVSAGGFAVVVDAPPEAVIHPRHRFPQGSQPLELRDAAGKAVLAFFSPVAGEHVFSVVAQLPQDGADPFAVAEHVVVVGGAPVVPPGPGPTPTPVVSPVDQVPPFRATAAVYVYEKDSNPIPAGVSAALNRLNRERQILATAFEQDTPDGTGEVPDQYRAPLAAAQAAGLPALVVMAGAEVVKVVKAPTTEAEVWGAVP